LSSSPFVIPTKEESHNESHYQNPQNSYQPKNMQS
jgi:hypothetical protein